MEMVMNENFYTLVRTVVMSSPAAFNTAYTSSNGLTGSTKIFGPFVETIYHHDFNGGYIYSSTALQGFSLDCLTSPSSDLNKTYFQLYNGGKSVSPANFNRITMATKHNAENDQRLVFSVSWTNTSATDQTFDTIKMMKSLDVRDASGSSTYQGGYFIFGSCTLDAPVTLAPAESKDFEISIALPTPAAATV
jgi:hypothetical protein